MSQTASSDRQVVNVTTSALKLSRTATLINTSPRVLGPYALWGKRFFDFIAASLLLILLAPLALCVALLIRISNPRISVLYSQTRVGQWGQPFKMYKFRTMSPDRRSAFLGDSTYTGTERRMTHKSDTDPRHTRLGRILRKTSLDELPQLVNVIRGDMSLVGPRPEILTVAERFGIRSHARHMVRPGITGLWQISELRSQLLHENVHIDLDYVHKVTLLTDFRILLSTVGAVLRQHGH